eukprot:365087-Chlamydomonas_euryale.AAC.16
MVMEQAVDRACWTSGADLVEQAVNMTCWTSGADLVEQAVDRACWTPGADLLLVEQAFSRPCWMLASGQGMGGAWPSGLALGLAVLLYRPATVSLEKGISQVAGGVPVFMLTVCQTPGKHRIRRLLRATVCTTVNGAMLEPEVRRCQLHSFCQQRQRKEVCREGGQSGRRVVANTVEVLKCDELVRSVQRHTASSAAAAVAAQKQQQPNWASPSAVDTPHSCSLSCLSAASLLPHIGVAQR